jgi:L-lactate dehydrogenase complex protein LldG
MASREDFIAAITEKLGRPKPESVEPPDYTDHPADGLYDSFSHKKYIAQFAHELEALSGKIIPVKDINHLGDAIEKFLIDSNSETIVVWDDTTELGRTIHVACERYTSGDEGKHIIVWNENMNRDELLSIAERVDTGLVYARYGISETGTVVLYNKGGNGRAVSLLPNRIGIVLPTDDIVPRITQVLEHLADAAVDHSCINFISGPSRSADIEMSLSIGVHGPGDVTVFLVGEQ